MMELPVAGLGLPHCAADDRLRRILSVAVGDRLNHSLPPPATSGISDVNVDIYWDAPFFNLDRVDIFQTATAAEQSAILSRINHGSIEEAYFIEKAGMGYMAKMVLLAETTEEQMLYSLFAADEALHLSQIERFLVATPTASNQPFLNLLAGIVAQSDKTLLLFVLQVVLEGWGLSHYRYLARECRHPVLAQLLRDFLQAESQHHATGVSLFQRSRLDRSTMTAIVEVMQAFLSMIRVGPQRALSAIHQVKGDLSPTQQIRVLEELDTENHSGQRLQRLRSLMQVAGAEEIVQQLADRDLFQPLPAQQCLL